MHPGNSGPGLTGWRSLVDVADAPEGRAAEDSDGLTTEERDDYAERFKAAVGADLTAAELSDLRADAAAGREGVIDGEGAAEPAAGAAPHSSTDNRFPAACSRLSKTISRPARSCPIDKSRATSRAEGMTVILLDRRPQLTLIGTGVRPTRNTDPNLPPGRVTGRLPCCTNTAAT
jgi:hypothetical protein